MGHIYPLPPVRAFEAHNFHELGVLLDHMLHAHDLHEDMGPRINAYFGEYLSAASFFREDRAQGWDEPTVAVVREQYPALLEASSTPLTYVENKIHALLRQIPKKFWDLVESSGEPDAFIERIKVKVTNYRRVVRSALNADTEAPENAHLVEHLKDAEGRMPWDMQEELAQLKRLLGPDNMPVCTFTINGQKYTISNTEPLVEDRPVSYPALVLFICATSGIAMVDGVKIPRQYRNFLTKAVGNEADITFMVQCFMERAMRENPSLQSSDFPQFDYEKARPALDEGPDMLALFYHTHAIAGKAKPDSLEAIRRFYAFASGESPDKPIPCKITSLEQAAVLVQALARRHPESPAERYVKKLDHLNTFEKMELQAAFLVNGFGAQGRAAIDFLNTQKSQTRGH